MKDFSPTLVVGFGNLNRSDDGVAFHVVNAIRARLGLLPIDPDFCAGTTPRALIDAIFVHQPAPEHLPFALQYHRIIFTDAHLPSFSESIRSEKLFPKNGRSAFTHSLTPENFLAWLKYIYGHSPDGFLVSVKAFNLVFGSSLTSATRAFIYPAVDLIFSLIKNSHNPD